MSTTRTNLVKSAKKKTRILHSASSVNPSTENVQFVNDTMRLRWKRTSALKWKTHQRCCHRVADRRQQVLSPPQVHAVHWVEDRAPQIVPLAPAQPVQPACGQHSSRKLGVGRFRKMVRLGCVEKWEERCMGRGSHVVCVAPAALTNTLRTGDKLGHRAHQQPGNGSTPQPTPCPPPRPTGLLSRRHIQHRWGP